MIDREEVYAYSEELRNTIFAIAVVIAAICLAIALLFARNISKPIRVLTEGSQKIGGGDLDHRIEIYSKDEIGNLAASFNNMAQDLSNKITEYMLAQEELRKSEEKYRNLFEGSKDAICVVTQEGNYLDFNQAYLDLFSYTREEVLKLKSVQLYYDPYDRMKFQQVIKQKGFVKDYEAKFRKKDGTKIDCFFTFTVLKAANGSILGYQGIIRDVSEEKQAKEALQRAHDELEMHVDERTAKLTKANKQLKREIAERNQLQKQLLQSQKMEAIGQLAGGVAHDFNTLLGTIFGYGDMLRDHLPEGSRPRDYLEELMWAAFSSRDLVMQLLNFGRPDEENRKPLQLSSVIEESVRMSRASLPTTINIHQNIEAASGTVLANPIQIQQVIINLCMNAGWAIDDKMGELEVSLKEVQVDADLASLNEVKEGSFFRLTVKDTGCGMQPEILDNIFEPFFTTKDIGKGSGLGLSVVHGIVKSHGGFITVDSDPGKGSKFHVYLPKFKEIHD